MNKIIKAITLSLIILISITQVSVKGAELILTTSQDGSAKLWALSGNCLATFQGCVDSGRSYWTTLTGELCMGKAAFNPAFNQIVVNSHGTGLISIWDLSGTLLVIINTLRSTNPALTLPGAHTAPISSVTLSPIGSCILTASWDCTAKLWDWDKTAKHGTLEGRCLVTLQGHAGLVHSAAFNPAGDRIITASSDNTAKLWDLDGNCLVTFEGHRKSFFSQGVSSAVFNPAGDRIATASWDDTAKLWDLDGTCLATFEGHRSGFFSLGLSFVTFNPAGDRIITASYYEVKLWDLDGNCLATLNHSDRVCSAAFNLTGDYLITASWNKVKLWNLHGTCLATLQEHSDCNPSAAFNSTGDLIITASKDCTASLWNLNGNCLTTFQEHTKPVSSAIFINPPDII